MRRVGVIGPGRVGTALARGLVHAGDEIVAVAGRGQAALDAFRAHLDAAEVTDAAGVARLADLVLVAVGDDAIAAVVDEIVAARAVRPGQRWVHTAGGHGIGVLGPIAEAGGSVAACHPAQSFPDADTGLASLPGSSWAVTAASEDVGWASVLVTDLRGSPLPVAEERRALYHTGLAVGANATSSIVTVARDLLVGAGIDDAGQILGPLVTTSAGNAAAAGAEAITGPVSRGDAGTVARQIAELRRSAPEAVDAFLALSRLMLAQVEERLDPEAAAAVARTLDAAAKPHGRDPR